MWPTQFMLKAFRRIFFVMPVLDQCAGRQGDARGDASGLRLCGTSPPGKDAIANRNDSKLSSTKELSKIHFDISDRCNA
jgi:hypothetical protein